MLLVRLARVAVLSVLLWLSEFYYYYYGMPRSGVWPEIGDMVQGSLMLRYNKRSGWAEGCVCVPLGGAHFAMPPC